jgi:hypothetical protein
LRSRCSITWATPPVHFALVTLEIGSANYLPKLPLDHNPPDHSLSKYLGLQVWATGTYLLLCHFLKNGLEK